MTFVKICGITNLDDAHGSIGAGADALGFNFFTGSKRYVAPSTAGMITKQLDGPVLKVGVFVNEDLDGILSTIEKAGLSAVQLHGDETPGFIDRLRTMTDTKIIKALRTRPGFVADEVLEYNADAILLDAFSPDDYGGTGQTIVRDLASKVSRMVREFYLAGGLSPENVGDAIAVIRPFAVDACSSLEISPGKKDLERVKEFVRIAKETQ